MVSGGGGGGLGEGGDGSLGGEGGQASRGREVPVGVEPYSMVPASVWSRRPSPHLRLSSDAMATALG